MVVNHIEEMHKQADLSLRETCEAIGAPYSSMMRWKERITRGRAAVNAEQSRRVGEDVHVGIVEAGDDGHAPTVHPAPVEAVQPFTAADPDYTAVPDRHHLRPRPTAAHGQHVCVIQYQVRRLFTHKRLQLGPLRHGERLRGGRSW